MINTYLTALTGSNFLSDSMVLESVQICTVLYCSLLYSMYLSRPIQTYSKVSPFWPSSIGDSQSHPISASTDLKSVCTLNFLACINHWCVFLLLSFVMHFWYNNDIRHVLSDHSRPACPMNGNYAIKSDCLLDQRSCSWLNWRCFPPRCFKIGWP